MAFSLRSTNVSVTHRRDSETASRIFATKNQCLIHSASIELKFRYSKKPKKRSFECINSDNIYERAVVSHRSVKKQIAYMAHVTIPQQRVEEKIGVFRKRVERRASIDNDPSVGQRTSGNRVPVTPLVRYSSHVTLDHATVTQYPASMDRAVNFTVTFACDSGRLA